MQTPDFTEFDKLNQEFSELFNNMKNSLSSVDIKDFDKQFSDEIQNITIKNPLMEIKSKMNEVYKTERRDQNSRYHRQENIKENKWGPENPYYPTTLE